MFRAALIGFSLSALLGTAMGAESESKVGNLPQAMQHEAPKVLAWLRDKGCKKVGVLKFRVKKGDAPATDSAGPINLAAANQLEVALTLANPIAEKDQVIILRGASDVAPRFQARAI